MPTTHVVKRGQQSMMYIAHAHGFQDWRTIWEHPANEALRTSGRHPQMLAVGTELVIPGPDEEAWRPLATNTRNTFRVEAPPRARVRVCLHDWTGAPYAYRDYEATIQAAAGGSGAAACETVQGQTGAQGLVELEVPDDTHTIELTVKLEGEEVQWRLEVGALEHPVTAVGLRAHLINLGLLDGGREASEAEVDAAVKAFQASQGLRESGLDASGQPDSRTQRALEVHAWIDAWTDELPKEPDLDERAHGRRELMRDLCEKAGLGLAPWAMFATDGDVAAFVTSVGVGLMPNAKDTAKKLLKRLKSDHGQAR